MIRELDRIVLTAPVPDEGLEVGDVGTVVLHRYRDRKMLKRDLDVWRKGTYLAGVLREQGVTHVHAPWADHHAFLVLIAARLLGISYSVQARAYEVHRSTANHALAENIRHARFVITNSEYNAALLRPMMGNRADAVQTIYNGLDLSMFEAGRQGREPGGIFRILSIGRLVEQKGFVYLLRACRLLRDRGVGFQCDIIGGEHKDQDANTVVLLRRLHRQFEFGDCVRFSGSGRFSEVLDAYRAADVLVLPCVIAEDGGRDVTPNVLLEAMACGLAVVSTAVAAIPEIVDHGVNGWLVPPNDAVALADAIEMLSHDPALRRRLGEGARRKVEERFNIERNIGRYAELFGGPTPAQVHATAANN